MYNLIIKKLHFYIKIVLGKISNIDKDAYYAYAYVVVLIYFNLKKLLIIYDAYLLLRNMSSDNRMHLDRLFCRFDSISFTRNTLSLQPQFLSRFCKLNLNIFIQKEYRRKVMSKITLSEKSREVLQGVRYSL